MLLAPIMVLLPDPSLTGMPQSAWRKVMAPITLSCRARRLSHRLNQRDQNPSMSKNAHLHPERKHAKGVTPSSSAPLSALGALASSQR
jgi:hypothetical protein